MQLLIQSAMIFFGTLFAAGLLALAEPQVTTTAARLMHKHASQAVLLARSAAAPATPQAQR